MDFRAQKEHTLSNLNHVLAIFGHWCHWFFDMSLPKVLIPPPQKKDFCPKNGKIWPKTGIFHPVSGKPR